MADLINQLLQISTKSAEMQSAPLRWLLSKVIYNPKEKQIFPLSPLRDIINIGKQPEIQEFQTGKRRWKDLSNKSKKQLSGALLTPLMGMTSGIQFAPGVSSQVFSGAGKYMSKGEIEALELLKKGTGVEELISRGITPANIAKANQRLSGQGLLVDFENALRVKDLQLMAKIAKEIENTPGLIDYVPKVRSLAGLPPIEEMKLIPHGGVPVQKITPENEWIKAAEITRPTEYIGGPPSLRSIDQFSLREAQSRISKAIPSVETPTFRDFIEYLLKKIGLYVK